MPDSKISQLPSLSAPNVADGDLLAIVDISAGTAGSKSIAIAELRSVVQSNLLISSSFSWGDASPKTIGTVLGGRTVFNARLVIQVAFNGSGPSLSIGPVGSPSQLMTTSQNDPASVAEYITSPNITYGSDTIIQLTITPGSGNSQGSGFVILETS